MLFPETSLASQLRSRTAALWAKMRVALRVAREPLYVELKADGDERYRRCFRWDTADLEQSLCRTDQGFHYT